MANVIKRAEVCGAKLGDDVADIIFLLSTFEKLCLVMQLSLKKTLYNTFYLKCNLQLNDPSNVVLIINNNIFPISIGKGLKLEVMFYSFISLS